MLVFIHFDFLAYNGL